MAKVVLLIIVVVLAFLVLAYSAGGWGIFLFVLMAIFGVAGARDEYKSISTSMSFGQWALASLLSTHVVYAKHIELKPYNVPLPQALATVKSVLTFSHRGTNFWTIRLVDEPTGVIQAILQFEMDPLRPNDKTTQIMIVLIAQVNADEKGKSVVKFEYEISANYGRKKECEEVIQSTNSSIEEGLKKLENPVLYSRQTMSPTPK